MGPIKTHGPNLLSAIELNEVNKVTDILTNKFRDKQKTKQFLVSEIRRPQSESVGVPLLAAAALDDPAILRFLVNEHGADVNFIYDCGPDKRKRTQAALTTAVRRGSCAVVDAILSLGGDINLEDQKGRTALMLAVRHTDRRMVRLLLSRGARVDLPDAKGNLPLHVATAYGHKELVSMLVSYGGDIYKPSGGGGGLTPIHLAAREGHSALLRMFGELYRADGNVMVECADGWSVAPIHIAATEANTDSVMSLIEFCSADPNLKDSDGNTALHCAMLSMYNGAYGSPPEDDLVDTVRMLIKHGANVDYSNNVGETPLHLSARNGYPKLAVVLVESGCDPTCTDTSGYRAVDRLGPHDEFLRRLIMGAMADRERSRSRPVVPEGRKVANRTRSNQPRNQTSDVDSDERSPPAAAARPRPAVRKTKSVENLEQASDDALNQNNASPPKPALKTTRIRSNSVQEPEPVDLNSSDVSLQSGKKKMSLLKQKKAERKVLEGNEQTPADASTTGSRIMKVEKPPVAKNDSLDRTTDSEELLLNGHSTDHVKGMPPRVPRKISKGEKQPEKGDQRPPSLQAWLDEQARIIKEKEKSEKGGGPVAQSTPPVTRNFNSVREIFENNANDSDSDAGVLNSRNKKKPPPPPKPGKAKKTSVSSAVDVPVASAEFSGWEKAGNRISKDSQNLKDVPQNLVPQRRGSQQSLTGIAHLGMGEHSFGSGDFDNGSGIIGSIPSPSIDSPPAKVPSRLNMSLDSARSSVKNKENRPIPKSRQTRSGTAKNQSSNLDEDAVGNRSFQQHVSTTSDDRVSSFTGHRKQPLFEEEKEKESRKTINLVFERAAPSTTVSTGKGAGRGRVPGRTAADDVDKSGKTVNKAPGPKVTMSVESTSKQQPVLPVKGQVPHGQSKTTKQVADEDNDDEDSEEDEDEDDDDEEEEETDEEEEESEEDDDDESEEEEEEEEEQKVEPKGGYKQVLNNSLSRKSPPTVRSINFYNQDNPGFVIVGGNAEGVFIHSLDPNSEAARNGLQNGDQILRANGQRILGRTREEATQVLRLLGGPLTLQVRSMMDHYKVVVDNGGMGDGFFVQAQFNCETSKKGELNIRERDIFSVVDTLLENNPGVWKAHKMNAKKSDEQWGTIPNRQKADQIMVRNRLSMDKSSSDQRGGAFFRSFRRSKSAERNSRSNDDDDKNPLPSMSGVVSYQRVSQRLSENRRPVVVLGLFCDIVISMLVRDTPELFETPQEDVENTRPDEEPVNVRLIRGSFHRGKHCLIILTPPSIEYVQQKTDLNPIIIYISPVSKSVVKAVKAKLAPNYNKNAGYMYDEAVKFEKSYSHLFSASVAYTTDDWWFFHLKEAIGGCQNQPIWRVLTDEDAEASAAAELNHICPSTAVMPPTQARPSRDKTPRISRTTDDLPRQVLPQNGVGRGRIMQPTPFAVVNRELQGRMTEGRDRTESASKPILKQRGVGGSVSSDQISIKSGASKNMSVSFDEQEPSEIPQYMSGKTSKSKTRIVNTTVTAGRETLL